MKRLILFRHAQTEQASASGEDFDRELTERGRRDAALIGRVLSGAGVIPGRVLVSAAMRCVQTWDEAGPFLPDARVEIRRDLYAASPGAIRAAADATEDRTVMLIGHNPGMQELVEELCQACTLIEASLKDRIAEGFPTGGAAAFEFDEDRTACLGLYRPRDHGGGR